VTASLRRIRRRDHDSGGLVISGPGPGGGPEAAPRRRIRGREEGQVRMRFHSHDALRLNVGGVLEGDELALGDLSVLVCVDQLEELADFVLIPTRIQESLV
jgi:hypothetical protein